MTLARIIWIVSLLGAILLSARFEMNKIQTQLNTEYDREVGIHSDLIEKTKDAANLLVIAEKYEVDGSDLKKMSETLANSSMEVAASNSSKMDQAFDFVVSKLMDKKLTEKDQDYVTQIHGDYYANNDRIERDAYHVLLTESETRLSQFPANLWVRLFGFELKSY